MVKRHVISMIVEDSPGVLTRVAGLFARRGFNIETITVGKTHREGISKMIISVLGDEGVLEQIEKQCNKLIDVIKVTEINDESIILEFCLVKVAISNDKSKEELLKYNEIYNSKIINITPKYAIIEIVEESAKINSFIELMKKFGILDISRTGLTAI